MVKILHKIGDHGYMNEMEKLNILKPCPFCGDRAELTKHFSSEMWRLIHRCKVLGPISLDWGDKETHIKSWNTRWVSPK